eukprot:jgi/Psemu1/25629/gm1.25629_g
MADSGNNSKVGSQGDLFQRPLMLPQAGDERTTTDRPPQPSQPAFKGRCDDLEGQIFDVGQTQATRFMETKNELAISHIKCTKTTIKEEEPKDPEKGKTMSEVKIIKLCKYYTSGMKKMRSIIHGKYSDAMLQKLNANPDFEKKLQDGTDTVRIFDLIKKICYKFEAQQFPPLVAIQATATLYKTKRGDLTASIVPSWDLKQKNVKEKVSNIAMVPLYVKSSNHGRYAGAIKQKLKDDFLVRQNSYHTTLAEAHNILINFWQDTKN